MSVFLRQQHQNPSYQTFERLTYMYVSLFEEQCQLHVKLNTANGDRNIATPQFNILIIKPLLAFGLSMCLVIPTKLRWRSVSINHLYPLFTWLISSRGYMHTFLADDRSTELLSIKSAHNTLRHTEGHAKNLLDKTRINICSDWCQVLD